MITQGRVDSGIHVHLREHIPIAVGLGLRAEHYQTVLRTSPQVAWFEVHSENYFGLGGVPLDCLMRIREHYPLSLHGVGLSIGSADSLDLLHLQKLKTLAERCQPGLVSEHLCWSSIGGRFLSDLLPLPYTEESLQLVIVKVNQVQDYLNRTILLENISSYLEYTHTCICESEFLATVARTTGCGILLDVNNLYVNSINHGWDVNKYYQILPKEYIKEIHLAGFTTKTFDEGCILIDTHDKPVSNRVWELYCDVINHFGAIPTLIEWDKDLPAFSVLQAEAKKAQTILEQAHVVA